MSKELRTEIRQTSSGTELVLYTDAEGDLSSYPYQMLTRGRIPFLLPCRTQQMDGNRMLCYTVTGLQSLMEIHGKQSYRGEEIRHLFDQILNARREMEEYLLRADQILLLENMIYQDVQRKQYYFIFLPGNDREFRDSLQSFCEELLPRLDHGDSLAVHLGYSCHGLAMKEEMNYSEWERILNESVPEELQQKKDLSTPRPEDAELWRDDFMNTRPNMSDKVLEENPLPEKKRRSRIWSRLAAGEIPVLLFLLLLFLRLSGYLPDFSAEQMTGAVIVLFGIAGILWKMTGRESDTVEGSGDRPLQRDRMNTGERFMESSGNLSKPVQPAREVLYEDATDATELSDFTEYEDVPEGEATEMIFFDTRIKPGLIPMELEPENCGRLYPVCFDKDHLLVGKGAQSDVRIPKATIGRTHSRIDREGREYVLTDVYSMNGTYVNGERLGNGVRLILRDQDIVTFAEISYRYWKDFQKGMDALGTQGGDRRQDSGTD